MSSESGFQQTLITLSKAAIRYQKQVCCCSQASSSSDTWPHVAFCILKLVVGCCSSHLGQKQVKALIHDLNYKDISGLSSVTAAFSNLAKLLLKSWRIAKYSFVWWQYQSQLVKEDHDKQGKKKKKRMRSCYLPDLLSSLELPFCFFIFSQPCKVFQGHCCMGPFLKGGTSESKA